MNERQREEVMKMVTPLADWLRGRTAVAGSLSLLGKCFSANFSFGHAFDLQKSYKNSKENP